MSNFTFSTMPTVSISRSRFERKNMHKTAFNLGQIIPIYLDECLPGDTRSIDLAALVRMSTPIAPIMDNIYLDFYAFFVPMRIVWDHGKEFFGENNSSAGIPIVEYKIPEVNDDGQGVTAEVGSYADYLGLPTGKQIFGGNNDTHLSALPFRGLAAIYNRWFRNQNLIAPLAIQKGDINEVLVGEFDNGTPNFACKATSILKASKLPDYFTTSLPYAQKGSAVSIPLGTSAPIKIGGYNLVNLGGSLQLGSAGAVDSGILGIGGASGHTALVSDYSSEDLPTSNARAITSTNLVADLSVATAATINQLRYAFQLQKLLEKDALYGTRYWEILAAHFGVESPDASLQDPEYLGGRRMRINIDQVLSTAGYAPDDTTSVGQPGANSVSGFKGSLFTKSFQEHGYLYIVAVARHDQTYGQGISRLWTRRGRYDFYWPVFANLGAQDVKKREIMATGTSSDSELFGYQEAWAEYRYKGSQVSAILNPANANSLAFWTLATRFGSVPTLSQSFIEQDRNAISDSLVTGSNGPDFIADFMFRDIAVRPMPVYSIPGLIDHH